MGWPPVLCEAATGGSRSAPAPSQLQPFQLKPALPHVLSVEIVDRCAGPNGRAVTVVTGSLAGDNLPSLGARTLRAMSKPFTLTTSAGIPVIDDDNSRRAGRRGPLLTDHQLFGKLAHFNRGRVPEHGAGGRP